MPVDDVVQHGVALAERAALRVLPAQAHAMSLGRQGRKGQRFGRRPIERPLAGGHRAPLIEAPLQRLVQMEPLGNLREPGEQLDQPLGSERPCAARRRPAPCPP